MTSSAGIAHVCLVTSCMTIVRAKIDVTIPRKRKGFCTQHDKVSSALFAFFSGISFSIFQEIFGLNVSVEEVLSIFPGSS